MTQPTITSVDVYCSQGDEARRQQHREFCAEVGAVPFPMSEAALALLPALQAIESNFCAGSLHIVMEDGNLDDTCVQYAIDDAVKDGNAEEERIARALAALSYNERVALYSCFVPNDYTADDLD
ncbi:hypothetical protein [Methylorubrum extorquens]|uniref:Uncharacterized protein n=1 Tax=Methylorubrum extorquens DSM 13060 TaxID=882800 RepID=H1KC76_METEX|nr:hypothetical protein [Methylorubrum extorquens]EHP94893.1 hypothetical protein MetexDRAFT_0238 [Methylorubrum extorquens DSM 13060]